MTRCENIVIFYYDVDCKDQIVRQIKVMRAPNKLIKIFVCKLEKNDISISEKFRFALNADIIFIEVIDNQGIVQINQQVSAINRGRLNLKSHSITVVCHENVFSYRSQELWVDKFTNLGIQMTIIPHQSLFQDLPLILRDLIL